ncbi:unnamed protein product [Mytilus coruscus]|uniref:Uncharacterized protein n=1 Tax=Mytilus coruscus TaxID=42192 RepID=A0A6J8CI87_MYTCO|nr:unnamed protein product [Mytilus coruscus]
MPRSHIHGSPRRFHYGLNLTDDPGNAVSVVRYRFDTDAKRCDYGLCPKFREKQPERIHDSQDSDEEEEYGEDKLSSPSPALSTATGDTDTSPALSTATGDTDTSAALSTATGDTDTSPALSTATGDTDTSPALSTATGDTDTSAAAMEKKKTSREESTAFFQRLEHIQQSSQMQNLFDQMSVRTDARVAERQIDDFLWSEFLAESLQLVNTFKARSKRVQPATVQPVQQERADYGAARRLQTLNYSSYPGGYLPIWQQQYQVYQPPPRAMLPPPPATLAWACHIQPHCQRQQHRQRSQLHPVWTLLVLRTALSRLRIQTYNVSTGGQTDSLRELMKFSGIPTIDASCDSDIHEV